MEGVLFQELSKFTDERGWLVETFRDDETSVRPVMSYVSMTHPGRARGPHEHIEQTDYFCFFGFFRLYLWDNRKASPTFGDCRILETNGHPHMALVPPGVVHAYKNVGNDEGVVINLPDRLYRGKGKTEPVDEIRYENDPSSRFRID